MATHIIKEDDVIDEDDPYGDFVNEIADIAYDNNILIKGLVFEDY